MVEGALGDGILKSIAQFDYDAMWVLIFVTVAAYTVAGMVEVVVLRLLFGGR